MTVPFMRAYAELLVKTCHRRGAHAMGGMAAFIPSRRDPEVNGVALAKVREDKEREAARGLRRHLGRPPRPGRRGPRAPSTPCSATARTSSTAARRRRRRRPGDLLDVASPGGEITEAGLRNNVNVGIQYLAAWLGGTGRGRDLQPDGGRRHRRDLALARSGSGSGTARSRETTCCARSTRRRQRSARATRRRGSCSSAWPPPTSSSSS